MKIGICLPYMEHEYDRAVTLDWCRLIDAGPFSTLSCGERITGPTQDMRVLMSAAAALTERVRLMPSLYVLPMHSAVRVAKELASLDVLSNGRVTVTVGVGGREHDYRAVGAPFERRFARLDEQVATMRRIWSGEPPFEGADPVGPTPVQKGGPPILSGAMGPKSIARAAQWADGIYGFTMNGDSAPVAQSFATIRSAWDKAGRSVAPRQLTGFWYSLAPQDADTKLKRYVEQYLAVLGQDMAKAVAKTMVMSSPDAVRRGLDAIEELGCEEFFLVPATCELAEVERAAELIASR
jgi:alkanesulfonate monooxygenase SsuD/methylene tetrahydromethanopterin reductase-like flavin-dependent oxidoreductase (luciferase family)